jgi:C1A family cysteine protease
MQQDLIKEPKISIAQQEDQAEESLVVPSAGSIELVQIDAS